MLLSEVISGSETELLQPGNFENLGFISDSRDQMLTFLEDERFLGTLLQNDCVSAVITTPFLFGQILGRVGIAVCEHPRLTFAQIHNALCGASFYWQDFPTTIHPEARVHASAWIAERNVRIGPGVTIEPRATVLERCEVAPAV